MGGARVGRQELLHEGSGLDFLCTGLLPHLAPEASAAVSVPQCAELTTAASGIQYCDVTEGTGKAPTKGSMIRCCHYARMSVMATCCSRLLQCTGSFSRPQP